MCTLVLGRFFNILSHSIKKSFTDPDGGLYKIPTTIGSIVLDIVINNDSKFLVH